MPDKIYFWAALCWTAVIAVLCLISFNKLPSGIEIKDADKYVHATLHLMFTVLWFLHFRKRFDQIANTRLLFATLALSIMYGIVIEIAQEMFTTTRQADMKDVLANLCGAVLGVLSLTIISTIQNKHHKK